MQLTYKLRKSASLVISIGNTYSYIPLAIFSLIDFGATHAKNAPNLFMKPVITSGFCKHPIYRNFSYGLSRHGYFLAAFLALSGKLARSLNELVVAPGLTAVTEIPFSFHS